MFLILPSIDIRGGRVVDLFQGDYARETVYDDAAEDVARRFLSEGATWIHVVDLDGSRGGSPENSAIVRRIVQVATEGGASVELGGGMRSLETARAALDLGVKRVIFGTVAVEHPEVVREAVATFGADAVVGGVDSRNGVVATRGWVEASSLRAVDLVQRMERDGVTRFVCTDINRDSTLSEPNFESLAEIAEAARTNVIASGGVSTAEQVRRLAGLGLEGAVIGSALYAGKLSLRDALAAAISS